MRIVMVSPKLGEAFGQEKVVAESTKLLRGAGHRVALITESWVGSRPECDGFIEVADLASTNRLTHPIKTQRVIRAVLRFLKSFGADVVHFTDPLDARLNKTVRQNYPTVLTAHTVAATCPASNRLIEGNASGCGVAAGWRCGFRTMEFGCLKSYGSALKRWHCVFEFTARKHSLLSFDRIIAVSDYMARTLVKNGFDSQKIILVPNPVNESEISAGTPVPRILCASRLVAQKGIPVLINALEKINDLPWSAFICGEGPLESAIADLVKRRGLGSRISLLGHLPHSQLRTLMAASRFLVQPSVAPESFGLAVAEALRGGLPVIASRIPALDEIVRDGIDGILVTAGDSNALAGAMRELLTDDILHAEFKKRAPHFITQNFAPILHLEKTLAVYRDVVAMPR
jgi:glycosyltransferase involved in cell wall biosynthesis